MNMKRLTTILLLSASLFIANDASAQGFLKGLKEKAEKGLNSAIGSFLGEEPKEEAPAQQSYSQPTQQSSQQSRPRNSSSSLPPSRATDARALFAEFPSFPTVSQAASLDTRDQYDDKISVIKDRIKELKDAVPVSREEQIKIAQNYSDEYTAQQMGMTVEEYRETMAGSRRDMAGLGALSGLEAKALENPDELQRIAESMDMEKMEAIQEEMEKLDKKKNKTAADEKRLQELQAEYMELAAPMINLMGGMDAVMGAAGEAEAAKNAAPKEEIVTRNAYDEQYKVFADKYDKLQAIIRSSSRASEIEGNINNYLQKIWAEPSGSANLKTLYAEMYEYISGFGGDAAGRVRLNQKYYDQAVALYNEAITLADNASKAVYYGQSQFLKAPYDVLEVLADVYHNVFSSSDVYYEPFIKTKLNLGLKDGETLYIAESFYNLMDAANISFSSASSSSKDFGGEFLCKATFLVYNQNDRNYYSLQCGNRNRLTVKDKQKIDFSKPLNTSGLRTETITMNSTDKKITLTKDGTLELPGELYYFPIAIRRTSDWLEFITVEYNDFYLCRFRL